MHRPDDQRRFLCLPAQQPLLLRERLTHQAHIEEQQLALGSNPLADNPSPTHSHHQWLLR